MNLTIRTRLYWGAFLSLASIATLAAINIYISRARGIAPAHLHGLDMSRGMILASAAAFAASVLLAAWFAAWLIVHVGRNIGRLNRALAQVAEGRPDVHVAVAAKDEIGEMADSLNRTVAIIKAGRESLAQVQGQLLQSEKMASLGQLAAGVAHEINNPVGFVKSNLGSLAHQVQGLLAIIEAYESAAPALSLQPATLARIAAARDAADFDYVREDIVRLIAESTDGVARIQGIVKDLKEFSHPDNAEFHPADLHKGLDSTLNIVWNELKYKATVVKEYGAIPQIECVPAQINQVFMNLLVNAAHAIDAKGTITLRTGAIDGGVWIEVADTGRGIAPEHLPRIFEPFFTTKPVGQGTGLGLSLAYGIVRKHGGTIDVRSEVGKGSVFRVWLPLRKGPVANTRQASA